MSRIKKGLVLGGICPCCQKEYIYTSNGTRRKYCSAECKRKVTNRKLNARRKDKESKDDYIPFSTVKEMVEQPAKNIVKIIQEKKVRYLEREREWQIHESIFDFLPIVKTVAEL